MKRAKLKMKNGSTIEGIGTGEPLRGLIEQDRDRLKALNADLLKALKIAHKLLLDNDIIMTGNNALISRAQEGKSNG